MKHNFYVELLLKEEIVEGRPEHSLLSRRTRTAYLDVLEILHHAAGKAKITGLILTLEDLSAGWGRLTGLRRAIQEFRVKGKTVFCFMEGGGNAEYYLAAACDRVFMPPAASLNLVGLASEVFFFREILDRFGLEPQLQAEGEFKSAGEMFTRTRMSPPSREQLNVLLDDFHAEFCTALAESRGITREEMSAKINAGPYTARNAAAEGLIDGICYQDEVAGKLKERIGEAARPLQAHKVYPHEGRVRRLLTWRRPRVAFVDLLGNIVSGEHRRDRIGRHMAGAETIGKFLEHAKKSRRIRAVVVRIDSPGGTGAASDLLWRKIMLLKEEKPVIVSCGDVAASGGYYVAAAGSHIIAEPTTITGSIGVLGGKFVARELMKRLSIYRESVCRGEHAEFDSPFTPFTRPEEEKLEQQLREFYREDFLKKVASGRNLSEEAVDKVGRGRVWSGLRAKEHGLIDSLGGPREAVQEARRIAGIPDKKKIRLVHYYPRRRWRDLLALEFTPLFHAGLLPRAALELIDVLGQIGRSDILLWMPFRIRIK